MILTILHIMQWLFTLICVPLFALLLYALFKDWRTHVTAVDYAAEYQRGYDDGQRDGYEAGLLARVVEPTEEVENL